MKLSLDVSNLAPGIGRDVVIPEAMVGAKHIKASRLLNTMAMKYQIIMHYLEYGDSILEVGCGSGYGASMLAASGFRVTGIDLSEKNLGIARLREGVEFLNTPLAEVNGQFDAVIMIDVIEHLPLAQQPAMLWDCWYHVKPGGFFLIDTPLAKKSGSASKHHVGELTFEDFGSLVNGLPWERTERFSIGWVGGTFAGLMRSDFKPTVEDPPYSIETIGIWDQLFLCRK